MGQGGAGALALHSLTVQSTEKEMNRSEKSMDPEEEWKWSRVRASVDRVDMIGLQTEIGGRSIVSIGLVDCPSLVPYKGSSNSKLSSLRLG